MPKRVMIATGGTGGHIFPAVALAQQIKEEFCDAEVLFVGGGLDRNKYFDRTAYAWQSVESATFAGKSPVALCGSCFRIVSGIRQSCAIIRRFKPDLLVGFGSYYSFPPLVAARLMSVPFILHEANSVPGKVNKFLSRWAASTGVHFPGTASLVEGKAVEVGMPLRKGFRKGMVSAAEARHYFGLDEGKRTVLVFGGSQGAQTINDHFLSAMEKFHGGAEFQVVHIAGDDASACDLRAGYQRLSIDACVKPFETRMDMAWQAADAVICRSGAGAVAELLEFEVPAILIPFARAADDHQNYNADFIVDTVGGGVKVPESRLPAGILKEALAEMFDRSGSRLQKHREAMAEYKRKARTRDMLSLVRDHAK